MTIRRALLSVSDKTGLVPFAKALYEQGVELISTGGTKRALEAEGLSVTGVDEVTGFPEILEGRVKTLHPNIHGGLLAKREEAAHEAALSEAGINYIDLVVVNLYPFRATIENPESSYSDAIENIDIGGPSMLRAAAKNHADVTVVTDPADYEVVAAELKENGATSAATRQKLAAKVFRHTAGYDALISQYMTEQAEETAPESYTATFEKVQGLRYGENPHQQAAFYRKPGAGASSIANAKQLHGKELSYNNINDAEAALAVIKEFTKPSAVAVKHMNPCGIASGENVYEAFDKTYQADPVSIFGGITAFNEEVDETLAVQLKDIFLEVIIAPGFTEEAVQVLTTKKNLRLLEVPVQASAQTEKRLTSIHGGLLVQDEDTGSLSDVELSVATEREPDEEEWRDLELAWKAVKHVKSNAIVLAKNEQTTGVGAGQMNRVGSAGIAIEAAGTEARNSVMASDAFFPMKDTVETAAGAGVRAIIQPGGSIRDEESIQAANEHGIAMVFTGMRHFKH
ncbi:IMP cyclohydrolase /phosphoribosylaminoimidazolecarboxamide formyltransferase [Salsuginibacillus halophilus]|uniref:Bifunctional purine biosynthesis protein PurH n=1 Tax=Salsuginibacillus halophilus TaxID=517424 RepID=A0A2P8HLF3_9BACI|nr:bifunctional phosphoribosylaminoimidazolecarboxamide formyltransferase/IMP cyclohydrolase [Salsuginibacillus halophilus]PSL47043.1 IMP cyclohydrolase /phosphoribosylaminoimidazolecarboxamide formyltransferase [Salsuginibacillus halophilus]